MIEHDRTDWIAKLWALKPVALVYVSDIMMKMKPHWQRVCSRYLRVAFCSSCCQWPSQSANVHYRRQKIIRKHRNEIPRLWLICSRFHIVIPSDHRFPLHEQIQWTWAKRFLFVRGIWFATQIQAVQAASVVISPKSFRIWSSSLSGYPGQVSVVRMPSTWKKMWKDWCVESWII